MNQREMRVDQEIAALKALVERLVQALKDANIPIPETPE
jgi:hypothetical protein